MTKHEMYKILLNEEHFEYRADIKDQRVQELVELRVEDLNRKGCVPETFEGPDCRGCGACGNGHCPLEDWDKRHPEYKDDDIAKRIKALEMELYGWHKPTTHEVLAVPEMTVAELIEKLKTFPGDAKTSRVEVTVKLA